jgi:hypothetical protein
MMISLASAGLNVAVCSYGLFCKIRAIRAEITGEFFGIAVKLEKTLIYDSTDDSQSTQGIRNVTRHPQELLRCVVGMMSLVAGPQICKIPTTNFLTRTVICHPLPCSIC